MLSLGLDPSMTGFGWAVHDYRQEGPARMVASGLWSTPASDVFPKRYMDLRNNLSRLLREFPEIRYVGVESPPFGEQWSEGLYALFTHVNEAVYVHRRDVVHFDPLTVKMLAKIDPKLRPGKMFKSDMVEMARLDTGIQKWNHNIADAYLISVSTSRFWRFYLGEITRDDLTPAEHRAFAHTHTFVRGAKAGTTEKSGAIFKEGSRFHRFSLLPPE